MGRPGAFAIHPMKELDVDAVGRLDTLVFGAADEGPKATAERVARFREELARPWSHAWVARDPSGLAVAYLLAWHVADEVHVLNVATHPSFRRRGVARDMVALALDFARSKRATHVRLEVRRNNDGALRLYRAAGFFVVALRRNYYPDGEDAIDMDLALDPSTGAVLPREDEARLDG